MNTIKNWESARMAGAFPEDIKTDLQDINKEFHLEANGVNSWNLFSANLIKTSYKNKVTQPGEPNLVKIEFKNENPDQPLSFLLSAPKETGLRNIQLEIDNFRKILLPIDLPANHHLRYTGGSYIDLYDNVWNKIGSERLIQAHLILSQGDHSIILEGEFTGPEDEIKIEIRTLSPPTMLRG